MDASLEAKKPSFDELVKELGDQRRTLVWSPEQAIALGLGVYMVALFLLPGLFLFWRPENENIRFAVWLLPPVIPGLIAGFMKRGRDQKTTIVYDQQGFQLIADNAVKFEQSWSRLREIERTRQGIIVTLHDGSQEAVTFPDIKTTRESKAFFSLLRTFAKTKDTSARNRRLFQILIVLGVLGLAGILGFGRPTMFLPGYDGPIGGRQYFEVAIWALSCLFAMASLYGLIFFGLHRSVRKDFEKQRARPSRVGLNVRQVIDTQQGWPKPLELEPGKHYRYTDPEGVLRIIKERVAVLTIGFVGMFVVAAIFVGLMIIPPSTPRREPLPIGPFVALIATITAIGIGLGISIGPVRRRQLVVDDEIWIEGDRLIVKRGDLISEYPSKPQKPMSDEYPVKDARYPFGRLERYGLKPNHYEMDRRFLVVVSGQD